MGRITCDKNKIKTLILGAIILARMTSTRLPGKPLLQFNGEFLIDLVFKRLSTVVDEENIIISISTNIEDDILELHCLKKGYRIFRGSEYNVSDRFLNTMQILNVTHVLRLNGDNIFVNIDSIKYFFQLGCRKFKLPFFTNVKNRPYPEGMSIEIVEKIYYQKCYLKFYNIKYHQEHVMTYFYDNWLSIYFYESITIPFSLERKLAVDTLSDYSFIKSIFSDIDFDFMQISNFDLIELIYKRYNL